MRYLIFAIVSTLFFAYSTSAQNSIYLVTTNNAGTSTISVIGNGGGYSVTTTPSTETQNKFRFYNISANTYTYNVLRTIKVLNSQGTATASTFFCVGATCLPPNANTLSPGDYITLSPNAYDQLITYFDEISAVGYSEVYYKIFNANDPNDTLSFTIYYNPSLSVRENVGVLENISVYPIPADENINIYAHVNYPTSINISFSNILGQKIMQQDVNISSGVFRKQINVSSLPEGIYFLVISSSYSHEKIYTKRIIVNR